MSAIRHVVWMAVALLILAAASTSAEAQTVRRYDNSGRYLGREEWRGDTVRSYDRSGAYTGRAEMRGGTVRHYDRSGRYLGQDRIR